MTTISISTRPVKLSPALMDDWAEREVFSQSGEVYQTIMERRWPKNGVFHLNDDELVTIWWETWWHWNMARDWNADQPCAEYRGMITAAKFQLQRLEAVLTGHQVEALRDKAKEVARSWGA